MSQDAFSAPGKFWRGNLHCHSDASDGALPPNEVCRIYAEAGYDFVSLTDHFVGLYGYPISDTRSYRMPSFMTIPGAEIHSGAMENGEIWHLVAIGLPEDFAPPNAEDWGAHRDQETGPALARRARDAGAFVILAHPGWSSMSVVDALSIDAAHAVEIYNHAAEVGVDRGPGTWHFDRLLDAGRTPGVVATDDAHFHHRDYFGGWTMVKAEENDPEALLSALKAGHHYASRGPELHGIHWEKNAVVVESSPVSAVIVQGPGSAGLNRIGDAMTRTRIDLGPWEGPLVWNRVTVVDAHGKKAWSPAHRP